MKFTTFATAGSLLLLALAARAQEESSVEVTDTQTVTDTGLPVSGTETVTDVTGSASEATGLPTDLSSVPVTEPVPNTIIPPVSGTGAATGPLTNPSGSAPAPPRTSPTGASGAAGSGGTRSTPAQSAASQTPSNAASPLNVGRLTAGLGAGIVVAALL